MLHLIPRWLHRGGYRAAHRLRTAWWRWRRPMVHGACVIARDAGERVLLVRLSYGSGKWQLPGGGMAAGEDPLVAAAREFAEETGLALTTHQLLGQKVESLHGAINIVHVVTGQAHGDPCPDGREVVAARWFALDDLPPDCSAVLAGRIALLEQR
jgi:8-oxo-dGTP pyrophosphatase MutT (NUDIX family)